MRAYRKLHPDKMRSISKKYFDTHPYTKEQSDRRKQWFRNRYANDAEFRAKVCRKSKAFARSPSGKQWISKNNRLKRDALRDEAFKAYSNNGIVECHCCGEKNIGFLTLDHSNNDGADHRRKLKIPRHSGYHLRSKLKRLGWPKDIGIRLSCYNCNCGRQYNGGICPHRVLNTIEKHNWSKPLVIQHPNFV